MKDWTQLLPLVGVAVGSGMTLMGQALTDARALRRDRLTAQREAEQKRRADWVILERQTIIELQESIELIYVITDEITTPRIPAQLEGQAGETAIKIQSRAARLTDRELAADILTWSAASGTLPDNQQQMRALLDRLGENLRRLHIDP